MPGPENLARFPKITKLWLLENISYHHLELDSTVPYSILNLILTPSNIR